MGSLADNGGDTKTMLPDALLIDAIPVIECLVNQDQRGMMRPSGSGCDIGAVEQ